MAVVADPNGVTVKFFDSTPSTTPTSTLTGVAQVYSATRPDNPGSTDPIYGSQEWITDLLVGGNPGELGSLRPNQAQTQATSTSSKQVHVQWDTTAESGSSGNLANQITIAFGETDPETQKYIANEFWVLPPEPDMNPDHKFWSEWIAKGPDL